MLFISQVLFGNIEEALTPMIERKVAELMDGGDDDEHAVKSDAEEQSTLADYDAEAIFDDYAEMILQYGYASLFVCAFPLCPFLALINNFIEIRVDAFKIITEMKRPVPLGAEDIGTWFTILEIMATCGVVSNSLLVCFTSKEFTDGWSTANKVWGFVILEHAILTIRFLFETLVDDTPADVSLQLERQDFLVDKIIKLQADDDDDDEAAGNADDELITVYTDSKATHVAITTSAAEAAKIVAGLKLEAKKDAKKDPAHDKAVELSELSDSLEAAATGPTKAGASELADEKV
jgi:anoctamin-10/anoctamin-7